MTTNNSNSIQNSSFSTLPHRNDTTENLAAAHDNNQHWMGVFSPKYDIPPICLAVLVTMVNAYVIALVLRRKSLRTVTNLLLCSLALSDLVTGSLSIPLYISCNVIRELPVCIASDQFLKFTSVSTVSHLFAVTLDRYLAIIHSLRYCSLVTRPRGLVAICLIWIVSGVTSLVQLTWDDPSGVHEDPSEEVVAHEIRFDVACIALFFGVPLVFMAFAYWRIFREIVRQNRMIKRNSVPGSYEIRSSLLCEFRAVLIFASMLVVYVICWLPYFIIRLELNFGIEVIVPTDEAEYALMYLRFFTSLLNPFFYILGKNDFRKAVKLQLRRASLRSNTFPTPTGSCASRRASNQTQRSRDICFNFPVPDQIEL